MLIESLSTESCLPADRIEYWNNITSPGLTEQMASPMDPATFNGQLRTTDLAGIHLAEINAPASTINHSRADIARALAPVLLVLLPLAGDLLLRQDQEEALLKPGDYCVCDTGRPYKLVLSQPTSVLTLRIPRERVARYAALPANVPLVHLRAANVACGITSRFLRDLWRSAEHLSGCDTSRRYAEVALQLIASSLSDASAISVDDASVRARHRVAICQYIESRLGNVDLGPRSVATSLRMSTSYVHRVFTQESESLTRYIWRRRVEECASAFGDPSMQAHSVTSIAFRFGFNSLPHLSRLFREHYGMSPREYRRMRQRVVSTEAV